MNTEQLLSRVTRLRRRLLGVGLLAGSGWGLVAGTLLVLGCAWLDLLWELPPELRIAASAISLGLALLLIVAAVALALAHGGARRLARQLDRAGESRGQIISGVDLALEQRAGPPMTLVLAAMAVERAAELAQNIAGGRAVPWRPARRALSAALVLASLIGVGTLLAPRLAWTQWLRFTDPLGDHPPYSRVLYHVEPGDVAIVYGAGFDVRVSTEGAPVDRLDLVLFNEELGAAETLPMFPEGNATWRASVSSITASGAYFVRSHAGRSERYRIDVITIPRVEHVSFRIVPPAYTNRPAYEGPLPQGGIAGLPGTSVQVSARSNRPLGGGALEITTKDATSRVALAPAAPESYEVTGTFAINAAGQLRLRLTDTAGQSSNELWTAPIVMLTDEPPAIRLVEPRQQSFATPTTVLPVVISAEDDYGIAQIQLFRSLNDSRALPLEVKVPSPAPMRWSATVALPLADYGLVPGDEIKLFARASDTNPAGPGTAETPVATVRIISQDDFERMVRVREGMDALLSKYRQAQRQAEKLADEVERLHKKVKDQPADQPADKETRAELDRLADQFHKAAQALQQGAKRTLPYDLDKELRKYLERMSQRLEDNAGKAAAMAASRMSAGELAQALKRLRDELGGLERELEQQVLEPLEHLADIYPLLEDAARFGLLYERQADLAERLQSVRGLDPPRESAVRQRFHDLELEQASIRFDLLSLLDDIEDHVTRLPADPKLDELRQEASDFARAVRASGGAEAMAGAEKGLGGLSGTSGHKWGAKAAEILKKFLAQAKGGMQGQGEIALRFQPMLRNSLGNTIGQLLAEMGLLSGMGSGGQGGYSARRSTLQNVGLYGGLPQQFDMDSASAGGKRRPGADRNAQGKANAVGPQAPGVTGPTSATGTGDVVIPWTYRQRVAEYFQRIADETGRK